MSGCPVAELPAQLFAITQVGVHVQHPACYCEGPLEARSPLNPGRKRRPDATLKKRAISDGLAAPVATSEAPGLAGAHGEGSDRRCRQHGKKPGWGASLRRELLFASCSLLASSLVEGRRCRWGCTLGAQPVSFLYLTFVLRGMGWVGGRGRGPGPALRRHAGWGDDSNSEGMCEPWGGRRPPAALGGVGGSPLLPSHGAPVAS